MTQAIETSEEIPIDEVSETIPVEVPKPLLEIKTLDDLKKVLIIAKGGDPDAQQAIANFMNLSSTAERSYFPDKLTALAIGQLNGFGRLYYPKDEWNPYTLVADSLSVGLMGYKGFKSNQLVDITRQTPNLSDLKTASDAVQNRGLFSRLLGGSKEE